MDIYIKWNNDTEGILIPVLPESFSFDGVMNNTTVTIHSLGDINLKGQRGLYGFSFESFFPSQNYGFERAPFQEPYNYILALRTLFETNTTVHVVVTGTDINGFFTIESFNHGHEEKVGDVKYSISFREYREIKSSPSGMQTITRSTKAATTTTVTWKKGDTWQSVTKSVLGSSKTSKQQKKNNKAVRNKAKKKNPKKKEKIALIGYEVVIKP